MRSAARWSAIFALYYAGIVSALQPVVMVGGGSTDPNLSALVAQLRKRGNSKVITVMMGPNSVYPDMEWDMDSDKLTLDGAVIKPDAAFLRYDVFSWINEQNPTTKAFNQMRAGNLHTMLEGWLQAHHASCRYLNPDYTLASTNKLEIIALARRVGFDVPSTLVTHDMNAASAFSHGADKITKPVGGGGYAELLSKWLAKTPLSRNPKQTREEGAVIVQETLVQPEMRLFAIAGTFLAFKLESPSRTDKTIVDYRVNQDAKLTPLPFSAPEGDHPIRGLAVKQADLMRRVGLEFGAADFKRRGGADGPDVFLEINSGPMFAAFDFVSHSQLVDVFAAFLEGVPYRCTNEFCFQPDLAKELGPWPEAGGRHSAWIRQASNVAAAGIAAGGSSPGVAALDGEGGAAVTRAELASEIQQLRTNLASDLVRSLTKSRAASADALSGALSTLGERELQMQQKVETELLSHLTQVELDQKIARGSAPTQYGLMAAVLASGVGVALVNALFCRRYSRREGPRL